MNESTFIIPEDLDKKIKEFIEKNPIEMEWDYKDKLSEKQLLQILGDGREEFEEELFEYNLEHIFELEKGFTKKIFEEFETDLYLEREKQLGDNYLQYLARDLIKMIEEEYHHLYVINMNYHKLYNSTGSITVLVKLFSNYDCATSMDDIDDEECYLGDIYQRVKSAVNKEDLENEHANSYTASIFCFAFKTDILEFLKLKENYTKKIFIPKGTQYSLFSDFNGSGGLFEARTIKDLILPMYKPIGTENDCVRLVPDVFNHYGIKEVYGDDSFIDDDNGIETS